jgi:hypothetical protein
MLAPYQGSYLPFARTRDERDPRPALLERYPNREVYLYYVMEAVRRLRGERLLLDEDAAALVKVAGERQL